jgi:FkbM family methyltransferase
MKTQTLHGVKLIAENDMVVKRFRDEGRFEDEAVALWKSWAKPRAVLIDAGAYTGLYSIIAAKQGVRCLGFEPNTPARNRAQINARLNAVRVRCFSSALSDAQSWATLRKSFPMSSACRVEPVHGDAPIIEAVRLDDVFRADRCDGIKLDVEGHEAKAIAGGASTIERFKPQLICELLNKQAVNHVCGMLRPLGYLAKRLDQSNWHFWCAR